MERCYVLQIFEIESCSCRMVEIPAPYRSSSFLAEEEREEEEEERERIKMAFSLDGEPQVNLGTFVCRTFERARDIMLDGSFIPADWINCFSENDQDGTILEIYLSTDKNYLCKISRNEIY